MHDHGHAAVSLWDKEALSEDYTHCFTHCFHLSFPLNNQPITIVVGGSSKRNYRSVLTRVVAEPPVCFNSSKGAVCLVAGWEGKGLLMEIHSELIAGHYTTTGRDQRKELNGRGRRALVNHRTHTHAHTL